MAQVNIEKRNPPIQDSITIGTTSIEVSSECNTDDRTAIVYKNISTTGQTIWLAWLKDAVASSGIELSPGDTWVESQDTKFNPLRYAINAIASAPGAVMTRHERREEAK